MIAVEHQEFFSFSAEAGKSIPYFKILRPITGSVTACILMQQLEYWFQKYPNGFYKFLEAAPNNKFYKPGDSWTEELAFGIDEFRGAFDRIGVRYSSKTQYQTAAEQGDPFQGLFYCSYNDKQKGITVYLRNHGYVNENLRKILNFQFVVDKDPQFICDREDESIVPGVSPDSVNGNFQFTSPRNIQSPLYTENTYQRLKTERIKDPYKSPSGSEGSNPEPLLSSLSEGENTFEEALLENDVEETLPLLFSQPGVAVYSTSPEKVTKKPKAKKKSGYNTGFEDVFWPVVAHKTNKQGALAKWAKTEGIDPEVVKNAYLTQLNAHLRSGSEVRFFRRPEAWLNQRGWEDEVVSPNTTLSSQTVEPKPTTPARPDYAIIVGPTPLELRLYERELRNSGLFSKLEIQEASSNFSTTGIKSLNPNNASQELAPEFAT